VTVPFFDPIVRLDTLTILRCPYCGGRVDLDATVFHSVDGDVVRDAVLSCHCSQFPVVSGIAVMTVEGMAETAREQIVAGDPAGALRSMAGGGDGDVARGFETAIRSPTATYCDVVEALGPEFAESRYFLYRFSDPTFLVADAVVRALASAALRRSDRAIDLCGGSGHLTRTMSEFTASPVLMDWTFVKLWLARRFVAPGCQAVCADAQMSLPFASGAFRFAVCSDAFHYIWTKRLLSAEMLRLIDADGVVALTHVHNSAQPNPSAGMPLPPDAYRQLFEPLDSRAFGERALLEDVLSGRIDLSRRDHELSLAGDPAVTIVASRHPGAFAAHALEPRRTVRGELHINPLYAVDRTADGAALRLRFPSEDYAQEYGACRSYLPENVTLDATETAAIDAGRLTGPVAPLLARRVVLDLPKGYC
jgi:SAM-dependent methyltransferase